LTGLGFTKENTVGLANDCRDVLVWHTRTEKPRMDAEDALIKKYGKASNLSIEV
jgi:galactosylgalactosylxylosylprotein 3-beta-glucuronosyltransferase 3